MSRRNKHRPLREGEPNVPTTERIAQPPAEPNAPIQETSMPSAEETIPQNSEDMKAEAVQEQTGLTAKEMAAAEEANAARAKAIIDRQQAMLEAQSREQERPTLIEVAAQGIDALHAAIQANSQAPVPDYIPPPRTERQMTQLEAELEAGRRAQLRHAEQAKIGAEARARAEAEDRAKEGFTTPVHRPGDMVPHPLGGMKPIHQ